MTVSGVTGLILAAGCSSRMGEINKLTAMWDGKPLVRHVADAAIASRLTRVIVVTGHDALAVAAALPDGCSTRRNRDYAEGIASSIRCGLGSFSGETPVMILLGDMPLVSALHIDALLSAYEGAGYDAIVVATCEGAWGNPVLFGTVHFQGLGRLRGDEGARKMVKSNRNHVVPVEIGPAARRDFDTPEAFHTDV